MFWFVTKVHPFKIPKWNERTNFKTETAKFKTETANFKTETANFIQRMEGWEYNVKAENKNHVNLNNVH